MPTPTDLVTDLPADFEVFGQAVDTSMADLKGGTSGQILSKNSNTDMDFVWITNDQGDITGVTAGTGISGGGTSGTVTITNSMATEITAKGDLIVGTGSATFDNLAAGSNGQTLVADSSTSTGLRYQVPVNGNAVINGGMDIWQRGTSFTQTGGAIQYTTDRWQAWATAAGTATTTSRQTGTNGSQYALRFQRTAGNTNTGTIVLQTTLETAQSTPYAGKAITLSFYARKGADYSGASSQVETRVIYGTGTDQNATGFTGSTNAISQMTTLTTSWQRFQYTTTLSATATELAVQFVWAGVGTAGTNDYFEITQVQLEEGSIATPFKRSGGTIQGELAACQRYFTRIGGEVAYNFLANAYFDSTTTGFGMVNYSSMRTTPAATFTTASNYAALNVGTAVTACTVISADFYNTKSFRLNFTVGSARTAGQGLIMTSNNTTNGYIDISAEL